MKFRICMVAAALVLAGCSSSDEPTNPDPSQTGNPDNSNPEETEEPDPGPQPAEVINTEFFDTPLEVSVYPIQSDGQHALAQIDVAASSDGAGAEPLDLTWVFTRDGAQPSQGAEDLRLVDRAGAEIYTVAADSAEQFAASTDINALQVEPGGEPVSVYAYFEAPTIDSVDLDIPFLGYVPSVPVEDLGAEDEFTVTASDLDVGEDFSGEVFPLSVRSIDFDDVSDVSEEGDYVTWTLASDVLFDFGEHKLDKAAKKTIEKAIEEIKDIALEGGEIHLVGHTDDQGSASFNQELSEKRAASVQKVFEENFSGHTITSEGRGKSEPAVEGTSEEAREANRRVEIEFTAKEDASVAKRGSGDEVPETDAPTVSGHEQLEFSPGVESATDTAGISIASVTELDEDYLLGVIEVEVLAADPGGAALSDLYADGGFTTGTGRTVSNYLEGNGTALLTIATGTSSLYPIEYVKEENELGLDIYDIVGDPRPMGTYEQGDVYRQFVLWPNPGSDTVTIEVPDRMRFADVPVEQGAAEPSAE